MIPQAFKHGLTLAIGIHLGQVTITIQLDDEVGRGAEEIDQVVLEGAHSVRADLPCLRHG